MKNNYKKTKNKTKLGSLQYMLIMLLLLSFIFSSATSFAQTGGDGTINRSRWILPQFANGHSYYDNCSDRSNTTIYGGAFPSRAAAADITNTTTPTSNMSDGGLVDGEFAQLEGYIGIPATATSVSLRAVPSTVTQEVFTEFFLSINGGAFTRNENDLVSVFKHKVGVAGQTIPVACVDDYNIGYLVPSSEFGKWVRFGVAISDGRQAYRPRLQWDIDDGNGWVDIPTNGVSSTSGGDGSLDDAPDSDGDNVLDVLDLDDDNDGILDTDEQGCTPTTTQV